jgi:hypothetical protein
MKFALKHRQFERLETKHSQACASEPKEWASANAAENQRSGTWGEKVWNLNRLNMPSDAVIPLRPSAECQMVFFIAFT